jgi:cell division protein FtsW
MRIDQALAVLVVALLSVGVVMVGSASLSVGANAPLTLRDVLTERQAVHAAMAVGLMLIAARLPVMRVFRARGLAAPGPWIIVGSALLLILAHVPGIGHEVNGAWRWVRIGPAGFQPSELVKWGLPIALAIHAARHAGAMHRFGTGFLAPILVTGILCALIATEDLGTAVLVAIVACTVLLAGGTRLVHVALLVPAGAAALAAAVITSPYRVDRLRAFLDPYADPQGIGYHVLQSMAAVAGGGLGGRGLGGGVQKFGYLPEDTTDFIFAIVAEELGIAGSALVVFLYASLVAAGLAVVRRAAHPFTALLALGIVTTVALQATINVLVVTGLAPTKGIALPLISAGGTGWCLTALSIGLLMAIEREGAATLRVGENPQSCPEPEESAPCSSLEEAPAAT